MAVVANEINAFRSKVSTMTDALRSIDSSLSQIEDFGIDDTARIAFFQAGFGVGTDNPDITSAQFFAGVVALRAIRTAWAAQKLAIVQLRK